MLREIDYFPDRPTIMRHKYLDETLNKSKVVVDMRHQRYDLARLCYDNGLRSNETEPNFDEVFSSVWHRVFQPSPAVSREIARHQQQGDHVSLHVRSNYLEDNSRDQDLLHNAARCALSWNKPIFVATDSSAAAETVVQYIEAQNQTAMTAQTTPPIHI